MRSTDHMDWLPGLGNAHQSRSKSITASRTELETGLNTQVATSSIDEVQYSIVCDDCGKHFWSRSKADSHAALTAHVLHEEIISPYTTEPIPNSPAASSPSAIDAATLLTSMKEAEFSIKEESPDDEDSEGSESEEYSRCFDCGRHFWSYKAARNHAKIGHVQGIEMVPSSAPDGSFTFPATNPTTIPKHAASIDSSSLYSKTGPITASLARGVNPSPLTGLRNIIRIQQCLLLLLLLLLLSLLLTKTA